MYKHAKAKRPRYTGGHAPCVVVRYVLVRSRWGTWYPRRQRTAYETEADAQEAFKRDRAAASFVRMYRRDGVVEAGDPAVRELWFADQRRKAAQ